MKKHLRILTALLLVFSLGACTEAIEDTTPVMQPYEQVIESPASEGEDDGGGEEEDEGSGVRT